MYGKSAAELAKYLIAGAKSLTAIQDRGKRIIVGRKLSQISMQLNSIVDAAEIILPYVADSEQYIENLGSEKYSNDLRSLLRWQHERLNVLMSLLRDHDAELFLSVFTPELRRNLTKYVHGKKSAIYREMSILWDSDLIVENGKVKVTVHGRSSKRHSDAWFETVEGAEERVNELKICCDELGDLIKNNFSISDLF